MSQRAAPLKAKTLQKQTPSRGKREKQTTTQITRMEDERTDATRLETRQKTLKSPRSHSRQKTTYQRRDRRDATRETYANTKDKRRKAIVVEGNTRRKCHGGKAAEVLREKKV